MQKGCRRNLKMEKHHDSGENFSEMNEKEKRILDEVLGRIITK